MKKKTQTENYKGIGQLVSGNLIVQKVLYEVKVYQEFEFDPGEKIGEVLIGMSEIVGTVRIPMSEKHKPEVLDACTSGKILTLVLADGRKLDIVFPFAKPYLDDYEFKNSNPVGFYS